jgi:predicted RNA binding protein YcfA (HicA-like mRNA interferase family)
MGSKSYPPLKPTEVVSILTALGFTLKKQTGSHAQYEHGSGSRRVVTIDMAVDDFGIDLMQSMVRQSGVDRKRFYKATRKTGKKIGC